jgi:chaperonin GroES
VRRCLVETGHFRISVRNHPHIHSFVPVQKKGVTEMATATKKKGSVRLQPMGERIVVQREESEEMTAGGIVLPDSAKEKPARGTVVAIGSGKLLDDGSRAESQLKDGDLVLFSSYAGETVEIDDVEYLLMREDDVLAVIE